MEIFPGFFFGTLFLDPPGQIPIYHNWKVFTFHLFQRPAIKHLVSFIQPGIHRFKYVPDLMHQLPFLFGEHIGELMHLLQGQGMTVLLSESTHECFEITLVAGI